MINKKMRSLLSLMFLGGIVLTFSSCVRYYKVTKKEFPQGVDHPDTREITTKYVRSGKALDQFTTLAAFDALWLSNDTRAAYVQAYGDCRGKDVNKKEVLLKRQLEENKHWISFFILSDVRDETHTGLHEANSYWTVYLEVERDNKTHKLEPLSLKEVEIEPEYQHIFGKRRFNLFKNYYLVRFPLQDLPGKAFHEQDAHLTLVLSSPVKDIRLEWNPADMKQSGKILKDEDFYWC